MTRQFTGMVWILLAGPALAQSQVRVVLTRQGSGLIGAGKSVVIDVEVEVDTPKPPLGAPVDVPDYRVAQFDFSHNPLVAVGSFTFDTSALPGGGNDAFYTFDETLGADGIVSMEYNFPFDAGGTFDLPDLLTKIGEVVVTPPTAGLVFVDAIDVLANTPGQADGSYHLAQFPPATTTWENFPGSTDIVVHDLLWLPIVSNCCVANEFPGCDDPTCAQAVCDVNPFCCDVIWDETCAAQAVNVDCVDLCIPPGMPVPAVSSWGAGALGAVLLGLGAVVFARRRSTAP